MGKKGTLWHIQFSNKPGVYKIVNNSNGKVYIGSTFNVSRRMAKHKYQLRKGVHPVEQLQSDWDLNCDAFEFIVIEYIEDASKDQLRDLEQIHINLNKHNEYNKSTNSRGGNGSGKASPHFGKKHSEETKRKISESKKGSIPWNKGMKQS